MEVIERARPQLAQVISEPDSGIYDALNKGILLATCEVVGFLHADDLYADADSLSRIAQAFSDPGVAAVYGDLLYVGREDTSRVIRYWRAGQFRGNKLGSGWMPPHPTLYVRRTLYQRFGGFDTRFKIAADYDFMLRLLRSLDNSQACYLPHVLVRMRVGGASNRSLRNILRKSAEDYLALRKNRVGGIRALALKNIGKVGQFFSQPDIE